MHMPVHSYLSLPELSAHSVEAAHNGPTVTKSEDYACDSEALGVTGSRSGPSSRGAFSSRGGL